MSDESTYWIGCRRSVRQALEELGVVIGREVQCSESADPLMSYRDCTVPDESIDPLIDLWNETKLQFGYEDGEPFVPVTIEAIRQRYNDSREAPPFTFCTTGPEPVQSPPAIRKAAVRRRTAAIRRT